MANKEEILITLDFDTSDFTKTAAELNGNISKLNKSQKELKKEGKEGSVQFQKNSEALRANKKELSETNKTIDNLTKANKSNAGSNDQLKAQLSILTAERNKLSKADREGSERGKELTAQVDQITASLKENEEEVGDNRRSVGDYGKALEGTPFGSFISGIGGIGKAFLANPIGIIIAGIVAGLGLLREAFNRSEESQKKLGKVTAVFSGIWNGLLKILEPLANFIVDTLIGTFEDLSDTASSAIDIISKGLEFLGFDEAAKSVDNFTKSISDSIDRSQELADAQFELAKSQRETRLIELKFLKDAEKQRQIRDDESKSIQERIEANEKLGKILQEQSRQELAIANEALRVADLRIKIEGANTASLDERAEALIEIADIQERITGQESEQLVNINSLRKEATDKTSEEDKKRVDKAIANADRELQNFLDNNQTKIESGKFLNEELFNQEQERLASQLEAQLEFEAKRLEQGVISQQEFNDAVNLANKENQEKNDQLAQEREEAKKEQTIIDLENQREIDIANNENQFNLRQQELDRRRQQELESANKTGADKAAIDKKFDAQERQLAQDQFLFNAQLASQTFGEIASLAKEGSDIQKALAISQATINGALAVTSILAAPPSTDLVSDGIIRTIRIGAAIASTAKNISTIKNQEPPKAAKGGIFGGKPHSGGGTKGVFSDGTHIEVEKGELFAVVNKTNTAMLSHMSALNSFGGNGDSFFGERGGAKSFLQDGGIGLSNISTPIDSDIQTANQILAVVENLPAPVVAVQDINSVQEDTNQVEVRAEI